MVGTGHCIICGAERSGEGCPEKIICDDCGDMDKIFLFCANCRLKKELTPDELRSLVETLPYEVPIENGVILKVSKCTLCDKDGTVPARATAYRIRKPAA